jgi:hypothetical protein
MHALHWSLYRRPAPGGRQLVAVGMAGRLAVMGGEGRPGQKGRLGYEQQRSQGTLHDARNTTRFPRKVHAPRPLGRQSLALDYPPPA